MLLKSSEYYRRNLPHIVPIHGTYHVTFRVKNSIPAFRAHQLSEQLKQQKLDLNSTNISSSDYRIKLDELYIAHFEQIESELHKSKIRPLANASKASLVQDALLYYNRQRYQLICYSIMPNHVHVILMNIKIKISSIMKSIKGYSAYAINQLEGKKGVFWQDESYDHMIRSRNELGDTIAYILNNPVKSGICKHYSDHPFTWCNSRFIS